MFTLGPLFFKNKDELESVRSTGKRVETEGLTKDQKVIKYGSAYLLRPD